MILMAGSIMLSLVIVGFGLIQGAHSFGAYRKTMAEVASLTSDLAACADGAGFKRASQAWFQRGGRMTRSIAGYLVDHFEREPIRLHGRLGWVVDIDGLCDAKRLFRVHPAFVMVEAMPGMLMGIGILFTFLGLSIGVFGLDPTDADQLTLGVSKLLGGMSLAFLTSIAGIGSALWWTWRHKTVAGSFESGFLDLAEQLRAKPFLLEPELLNYQLLDDQAAQSKSLAAMEETVQRAFTRALEQAGLRGTPASNAPASGHGELGPTLERIGAELNGLNSGLALLTETQEKMLAAVGASAKSAAPSGDMPDSKVLAQLLSETQTVLTSFNGVHENQTKTVDSIREAANEMRTLVQSTRRTGADLVQNHRIMMGHIKKLEEHWDHYRDQLDKMQRTLETTIVGFQDDLGKALRGVHGEIDGMLAKSLAHFSDALTRFQETLDSLSLLARLEQDRDEGKKPSLFGKRK